MTVLPGKLREEVRLLGELLGENILEHHGPQLFRKIEEIRHLAKTLAQAASSGAAIDHKPLVQALGRLADSDVLPIARAFNQFLNLANIADLHHFHGPDAMSGEGLAQLLERTATLRGKEAAVKTLAGLNIELVLTAHPTEATRRTLIHKYDMVASTLGELRGRLSPHRHGQAVERLRRLIEEIWFTDEIRSSRPSAVDEAKWGFAVIENSLWQAVPDFLRYFDALCLELLGQPLPGDFRPLRFYSWMGGDRDGNPNVTSSVTREVILLGRWQAADLYLKDVMALGGELSMSTASDELMDWLGQPSKTPYRDLLHKIRKRLQATLRWTERCLTEPETPEPEDLVRVAANLREPLQLCYRSLREQSLHHIANGPLLDLLRKIDVFGINLLPLDIRQHSERHAQALDELTRHLGVGSYLQWNEDQRVQFLLNELTGKRPLIPAKWPHTPAVGEVLATCRVLASVPRETLSHYVISMTRSASDVLAVALLLKECGVAWAMPVAPLFETLDDLLHAPGIMQALWSQPWYRQHIGGNQTVMIGYSDSGKDAGKFSASWALYQCQEKLVAIAAEHGIKLTLFHGRGGTVGRGGGPLEKAMASQPPGSVQGSIRVTEQGEMIRYKFGLPTSAFHSLSHYVQATLRATVEPAPPPKQEWRALMEHMADASLKHYRSIVQEHPHFVAYFRALTPEQELGKLALGSRPAKRKAEGGVESLRAIPWVFAWTQVRMNLPVWLGIRQAIETGLSEAPEMLFAMMKEWPYFASFLDLIEMVLGKSDSAICAHYEAQLVDVALQPLGAVLRDDLAVLVKLVNSLKAQSQLLADSPVLQQSIEVRKPYIDPLNYLQAELLKRERRAGGIAPALEQALKVTMSGIAAGMRNTG
ncbi:MAG TPA: phosphoenolpyruvate carboxylase [Candidatus Acidoferrum sp.]|nr:phosphoenolpyruvate carboxylase [Candidatus Acidoferrum sp.]